MLRALVFLLLSLLSLPASAATYYLDGKNGDDARDGRAKATAWKSFDKVNAALQAGDTCLLRGGRYETAWISPANSGKPGAPITYAAAKGETPELTGGRYGCIVFLDGKSYITVRGLRIFSPAEHDWVVRISGKDAHHNRLEQCDVSDPDGYAPVVIASGAHDNVVTDCTLHDTGHGSEGSGDCIVVNEGAHHNTITRNRCYNGCHSQIMALNGSHHNVITDNELYATRRDWAGAGVNVPRGTDASVIEGNRIHDLGYITDQKCAIQVDSAHNSIRNNVIYNVGAFGIALQSYRYGGQKQEAVGNVVANNTLYHCGRQPLSVVSKGDCVSRDNRVERNIVVSNAQQWYGVDAWALVFDTYHLEKPVQPGEWLGNVFADNVFFHATAGEPNMVLYNHRGPAVTWSVPAVEAAYPKTFHGNLEADPQFVNPAKGDFRLAPGSPAQARRAGATFVEAH